MSIRCYFVGLSSFSQLKSNLKFVIWILNNFISFLSVAKLMEYLGHGIFELWGNLRKFCWFSFQKGDHLIEELEGDMHRINGIVFIKKVESILLLDRA